MPTSELSGEKPRLNQSEKSAFRRRVVAAGWAPSDWFGPVVKEFGTSLRYGL